MQDDVNTEVFSHIKIIDPNTGKIFLNKRADKPLREIKNDRRNERKNNRPLDNKG
jgi:hypothetical protein